MSAPHTTHTPHNTPTAPGKVLVVDDDPGVRRFVSFILGGGYAVTAVGSVEEATPLVSADQYDVALVDLDLPGHSGLELLATIPATVDLVPVLMTGTHDVKAAVTAMQRGAFDYLPKPTDPDELRWTVARAMGAAQAKRQERVLRRVVSEWEATFDACPDPLVVLTADGHVLRANRAAEQLAGSPGSPGRLVGGRLSGGLGVAVRRYLDAPSAPPVGLDDAATGRRFLVTAHPFPTADGVPVVAVARDITSAHQAERAKTRLAHQLMTAQEDERARIARELHDGLGQSLASIAMGLGAMVESPGGDRDRLATIWRVAADAVVEVRQMAHRFHPPVLDDLGLAAALDRLTKDFTRLHDVRADLIVPAPPPRLQPVVELALYRVVQEALANVARHADARTVDVLLERRNTSICVSVTDDGKGFGVVTDDGIGLAGMRERAGMLGGTLRIDSAPGRGTTIDLSVPIPEDQP